MNEKRIRILVMEDEPLVAEAICLCLENHGYEVTAASDGMAGLEEYERGDYDLLCIDYKMPRLSGTQVMEALNERGPLPPVIVFSGIGQEEVPVAAFKLGAFDYISKGIGSQFYEILPHTVDRALEKSASDAKARDAQEEQVRLLYDLRARVKELGCLYGLEQLLAEAGPSRHVDLEKMAELLCRSWTHDELGEVRIRVEDHIYETDAFRETAWMQAAEIRAGGQLIGKLQISYREQPSGDEVFCEEEETLLRAVAERLGRYFEQRHTEEQLTAVHDELRMLSRAVEQSASAIVITDPRGSIEYVNPRFTEITGYSESEVIGKNPRMLKSGDMPHEEYVKLWDTITAGDQWSGEFHNKKKNGRLYWDHSSISPVIDSAGNITHFVAVKEDITEKKRAAEEILKFKTIFDSANYGMGIARLDGTLTYVNDYFARIHGYVPDELVGRNLSLLHSSEDAEQVRLINKSLEVSGSFSALEVWHAHRDGTQFPMLMNGVLVRDERENPVFMAATAIDITERKKEQAELEHAKQTYEDLVTNLSVGVYRNTPGPEGHFLEANPAIVAMFEASSREEFMARSVSDLYKDPARRTAFSEKMLKQGHVENEPVELVTLEGRTFWASVTAVRKQDEQGQVYFDGVIEDITEQKVTESLRSAIFEISAMIAGCQTEDEICRVVVEGIRNLMGLDRCGLFLGEPNEDVFHGSYGTDLSGKTVPEREITWDVKNTFDVEELFAGAPFKSGFPLGSPRDIRPGEEDLRASLIALRQRGKLFGIISVDNRLTARPISENLLTHIALLAEVIGNALQVARAREALRRSVEESRRVNEELEEFNQAMLGREDRVIALKEEINKLLAQDGQPTKYPPVWEDVHDTDSGSQAGAG